VAKCINHPCSNATYFSNGFTYCKICEEYFTAQAEFDAIHTWDRPPMGEPTAEFENKLNAAREVVNKAIDEILRS